MADVTLCVKRSIKPAYSEFRMCTSYRVAGDEIFQVQFYSFDLLSCNLEYIVFTIYSIVSYELTLPGLSLISLIVFVHLCVHGVCFVEGNTYILFQVICLFY